MLIDSAGAAVADVSGGYTHPSGMIYSIRHLGGPFVGTGRGRSRRLSLGAAVTFAVAAVAAVVGGRVTGRLTLALGVFAALVVAGMVLTYWLDRSERTSDSTDGDGGGSGHRMTNLADVQQNIIAAAPGASAQGALYGNVVNHGEDEEHPGAGPPASSDACGDELDGEL